MKKLEKIFVASVIATLLCDGMVFGATRRASTSKAGNSRRAASITKKSISGTYNRTTNTYTTSTVNTSTTTQTTDNSIVCGTPASTSNNYAKRKCSLAYLEALKLYCKSYPCTSKTKVAVSFNFGLPVIENKVSMDIDGQNCSGTQLDTTCAAYQEDILSEVWDFYSEKNIRERKHCNMARAKADMAQACLQYIQSEKRQSVGGVLDASKKSKLDDGIDETCGRSAIINRYKELSIDDWDDTDEQYLSGITISNGQWTTQSNYQGKKEMSSTVASLFANVGDNTWNKVGQIGKLIELKLDMKSMEYPREVITLANTFITELETACGRDYAAQMADTTGELVDNRSALEKEIARKGLLKGTYDYLIDNTVGVVGGNNAAQYAKDKGILGMYKDYKDNKKNKNCKKGEYTDTQFNEDLNTLNALKQSCDNVDETTGKIKAIISRLSTIITNIESEEKYKLCRFENNQSKVKIIIEEVLKFARDTDEEITLTGNTLDDYKKVITKLSTVPRFNCPDGSFTKQEKVEYKFDYVYNPTETDAFVPDLIKALQQSAQTLVDDLNNYTNATNYNEIDSSIIAPMKEIK